MTHPYPLGRIVEHDEASRQYRVVRRVAPRTVTHRHYGPVLNQGDLGSCTGNAISQALNTVPLRQGRKLLTEVDAVRIYSRATVIDEYPGGYPPEDTGSSGLAVCKAVREEGLISSYRHAFGMDDLLSALTEQPVIVGTPWHEDMFKPDPLGYVHPTGEIVGGHEYALIGLNIRARYVLAINSWGDRWGVKGRFRITFDELAGLLADDGDCTVPTVPKRG